ncbi:MAG: hypothetical protein ACRDJ1_01435 [Actinomycetota bacterium]
MRRIFLVLLGLLVACGAVRPATTSDQSDQVVPWTETAYIAPTPTPFDGSSCSADDLELGAFAGPQPAAGTSYTDAAVRNVSPSPCALTPKNQVTYRNAEGTVVQSGPPLETSGNAVIVPTEGSVASGQAERISLQLAIPNVCPAPEAATVTLTLFPGSETLALPPGSGGPSPSPAECFAVGRYILSAVTANAEPGSPLAVLQTALRAPGPVTPGTSFRYFVDLTNPTAKPVALDPCPGYVEGLKAPNGGGASYLLNCTTVTSIEPGRTVTYEMYLEVPEGFGAETNPERRAILTWLLLGGGPGASAEVQVAD